MSNKARDELKSVREERKSWLTDHNAAVAQEMQTGAQSEQVAENLTQSLAFYMVALHLAD